MSEEYRRLRVLWPDHLGLARGKYVPAELAESGVRHCSGTWALGYDRGMTPYTPGSHWNDGLPDFQGTYDLAESRPGWEPGTRVVVADLGDHEGPSPVSPRGALRRSIAAWRDLRYEPYVGMEFEAYVFVPDGAGGYRPLETPGAYVYGTGPAVDPHGLVDAIWEACERAEIPLESVNSEYDSPQFEFTLRYADALRAADEGFLFKLLAREVAQGMGLLLTFMGKPVTEKGGSGLHFNMSVRDESGSNAMNDPSAPDGISDLAKSMIAGLLARHRSLAGVCAPTVNAYKRLRPASLSGYWANWGYDHRGATVRIPPERGTAGRIEHRLSDGAAVVHTAMAAVLHAARLGVVESLALPPVETGNGLDTIEATVGVPSSLAEALDALESDTVLTEALGSVLCAQHIAVKRTEWERFTNATTDWEMREYLPFL